MARYITYLIFGPPGSGKGTQGVTLGTLPQFFHCACGDVFRSLDTRTELGQSFLFFSGRGELVPDELTIKLWKVRIADCVRSHHFRPEVDALVLDGIPRNVNQAKIMEEMIDVRKIFHLCCPDREALVKRLQRRALKDNRLDDANEEVIRERLNIYDALSQPVLKYYAEQCGDQIIKTIDATQTPVQVLGEIIGTINSLG
ncbi:MAG: adenylate kinase family protein [Chthoniobacteraceae bacterium]